MTPGCRDLSRSALVSLALLCGTVLAGPVACTGPAALPPAPRDLPVPQTLEQLSPYRLQVGDVLDLKFPLNPELNEQVTIRPDGQLSTAFIQDVPAYGMTVAELTDILRARYRADLTDPRLSVILRSFAPNRVYVGGEVNAPGEFITIGPNLTVSQAIARAGGVKLSGDRDHVFIIRRGPHDQAQALSVDYLGVIRGTDPAADIHLAQYDVVYVARGAGGDAYQFANQFLLQFIPVSAAMTAIP